MSGDASAEEDAILEELAMISRNPPQDLEQDEEDEERDSFHIPGNVTRFSTFVEILKILIQNFFINKNPINYVLLHKFSIFFT